MMHVKGLYLLENQEVNPILKDNILEKQYFTIGNTKTTVLLKNAEASEAFGHSLMSYRD